MDFPMDVTKLQEMIEQAMKQVMINWSNSLADTAINTVQCVVRGGYQYYASALQPMANRMVSLIRDLSGQQPYEVHPISYQLIIY